MVRPSTTALPQSTGQPPRDRGEADPDGAGGVLPGDQQHPEDADGQLGQLDAGEADCVGSKLATAAGSLGGRVTRSSE